jgi:hypothetical protein
VLFPLLYLTKELEIVLITPNRAFIAQIIHMKTLETRWHATLFQVFYSNLLLDNFIGTVVIFKGSSVGEQSPTEVGLSVC